MAEPAARHLSLPSGLLELCALLGASQDSLRGLEQIAQKRGVKSASSLVPEVLSVFVPPFTTKEDGQVPGASCALGKGRRRSFRKKREKPRMEPWKSHPGDSKGPDSEDVTIPGGVDLLALPQLCFPGCVCVASEPKEDYIHFLVLTDVCGNRTYGVVSMPNLQDISLPELPPRNSSLRIMDTSNCRSSSPVLKVTPKSTYMFKIPDIHFPLESQCVQAYYTDFVTLLSKAMALLGPGDSLLLARYFYLRGLLHLMQGQLLSALLDFQNLYKTDIGIFPADLVKRTVESMSASERAQAERTPELRRLITEVFDKHGEAPKADDAVKNFELPKKHMQLNDFVKRVQESGIVKDAVIIHRLFDALTFGHEKQIDPETFRDFYTCWKETEAEAQEVSLPALLMEHLDKNECVYKLSSSVKTNRGVGKIAMTQA